jgi:hypothetical protein
MERFVFAKPLAFQDANIVAGKETGLGYFLTQGKRFDSSTTRICEDVHFVSKAEGTSVACGILDGHGGPCCAIAASRLLCEGLQKSGEDQLGAHSLETAPRWRLPCKL